MEGQNQGVATSAIHAVDARRKPRFKVAVDIKIHSKTCGALKGYTVDMSESGVSAILKLEVSVGEMVELQFTLPFGPVRVYAIVRQRNAFRYGFQFVDSESALYAVKTACRSLELEQALFGG